MANELYARTGVNDQTVYSIIESMVGTVWSTVASALVAYVTADRVNYDIAHAERGDTGEYYGTFPAALGIGRYRRKSYVQVGASPSELDNLISEEVIEWNGDEVVSLAYAGTRFGPGEATHDNTTGVTTFETAGGTVSFTETANAAGTSVVRS